MEKKRIYIIAIAIAVITAGLGYVIQSKKHLEPIRIGILEFETEHFANTEVLIADVAKLAIDEINAAGGLLGRPVQLIFTNAKSTLNSCVGHVENLIKNLKVSVLICGGNPHCRRKVRPIIEENNSLLIYTSLYEGLEQSNNIIYLANTPNQQVLPGIWWSINNLGKDFFLIGSDFIYSHVVHEIMKDHIGSLKGNIVGEDFVNLDGSNADDIAQKISNSKASVILHTVVGLKGNKAFFNALAKKSITAQKIPTMSFTLSEPDNIELNLKELQNNYATWSYLQSEDTSSDINGKFLKNFRNKFGQNKQIGDQGEIVYAAVKLWAIAVKKAGTFDPDVIKNAIKGVSIYAPEETIYIDTENNHAWRSVNIGRIRTDAEFLGVFDSSITVPPVPYPITRTREAWDELVAKHTGDK